jgi:hypothetical protein
MLKSIAVGEYVPPEERQKVEEPVTESLDSESMDAETEAAASPREKQEEDTPPETQVLIEPTNKDVEEDANEDTEPVVGDTSVGPDAKSE